MNATGPVLRDIHLPADPSWWPPAPGWWLLAALALLAAGFAVTRAWHGLRERRWRRALLAEVDAIAARHAGTPDPLRLAGELSQLLRRGARLVDVRAATLRGEDWLAFLDAQTGSDAFRHGPGRVLLDAPWQRQAEFDADALLAVVRQWFVRVAERERAHA